MKKLLIPAISLGILTLTAACSGNDAASGDKKAAAPAKTTKNADAKNLPNYRYVDVDSVLTHYNLSKDYNESMLNMQNNLESALRQKQSSLESMAGKMQQKMQNNGYTSQTEVDRDQKNLATAQANAQKEAADLQGNYEKQAMQMQKAVKDSIVNYVKIYNEKYGYDAIFMKDAALYINPELDITDEIIKGLNERYNKVKK